MDATLSHVEPLTILGASSLGHRSEVGCPWDGDCTIRACASSRPSSARPVPYAPNWGLNYGNPVCTWFFLCWNKCALSIRPTRGHVVHTATTRPSWGSWSDFRNSTVSRSFSLHHWFIRRDTRRLASCGLSSITPCERPPVLTRKVETGSCLG
jgi:hypothetical protein